MIGISACLGGVYCRYDGGTQTIPELQRLVEESRAIMVCPEVMGGLPVPRHPSEIQGGDGFAVWQGKARVINDHGEDVTTAYQEGTLKAYKALQAAGIDTLILKERSPSCGSQMIYDGSFSGAKKAGVGVATAYFIDHGMTVYHENNWQTALKGADVLDGD